MPEANQVFTVSVEAQSDLEKAESDQARLQESLRLTDALIDQFMAKMAQMGTAIPAGMGEQLNGLTAKYEALTLAVEKYQTALLANQGAGVGGVVPTAPSTAEIERLNRETQAAAQVAVAPAPPVAQTAISTQVGAETSAHQANAQAIAQETEASARAAQQTTATTAILQQEVSVDQQVAQGALAAAAAKEQLAQAEQRVSTSAKPLAPVEPTAPVVPIVPTEPQVIPVAVDTASVNAEIATLKETITQPIPPQSVVVDTTQLKEASSEIAKTDTQLQQIGTTPLALNATPAVDALKQVEVQAGKAQVAVAGVGQQSIAPKQPWQMTQGQYVGEPVSRQEIQSMEERGLSQGQIKHELEQANQVRQMGVSEHRASVQQAVKENQPIPPEVLKDYPDLSKQYVQQAESLDKVTKSAEQRNEALAKTPTTPADIVRSSEQQKASVDKVTQSLSERNKAVQQPVPPTTPAPTPTTPVAGRTPTFAIDEAKRQQEVAAITDSDSFKAMQARVQEMRRLRQQLASEPQAAPTAPVVPPPPVVAPVVPTEPQTIPVTADTTAATAQIEALKATAAEPIPPQTIPVDSTQLKEASTEAAKTDAQLQQVGEKPIVIKADSTQVKKTTADAEALKQELATPLQPIQQQVSVTGLEQVQQARQALESIPTAKETTVGVDTTSAQANLEKLKVQEEQVAQVVPVSIPVDTAQAQTKVDTLKESLATIGSVPPVTVVAEGLEQTKTSAQEAQQSLTAIGTTPVTADTAPAVASIKEVEAEAAKAQQGLAKVGAQPVTTDTTSAQQSVDILDQKLLKTEQDKERLSTAPVTPIVPTAPIAPVAPAVPEVAPIPPQIAVVDSTQLKEATVETAKVKAGLQGVSGTPVTTNVAPLIESLKQAEVQANKTKVAVAGVGQPPPIVPPTPPAPPPPPPRKPYVAPEIIREERLQDVDVRQFANHEDARWMAQQKNAALVARQVQAPILPVESPTPIVSQDIQPVSQLSAEAQVASRLFKQLNGDLGATKQGLAALGYSSQEASQFIGEAKLGVGSADEGLKKYNQTIREYTNIGGQTKQTVTPTPVVTPEGSKLIQTTETENQAATARLDAATFKNSIKGKDLVEQYDLIGQKLSTLNPLTSQYTNLLNQQANVKEKIAARPITGSLEEARINLAEKKAAFTGDDASTRGLATAAERYSVLAKQATKATEEFTGAQSKGINIGNLFERQIVRIAIGFGIWQGIGFIVGQINSVIAAEREYSIETAKFSAITGQSVGAATEQWNKLADAVVKRGIKPSEAAPAFIQVAQFTPDQTGQQQILDTAAKLEEAFGIKATEGVKSLVAVLRQAGEPASAAAKYGDLIAASYAKIPGTAQDYIAALQEAIPLSRQWGTGVEETFSAILQASAAAAEAPENVANALGRVTSGLNDLGQGGEKSYDTIRKLRNEFNITAEAGGKLRPIPDILQQVANILPNLSPTQQQSLIETLVGGNVRPDQFRTLLSSLVQFKDGIQGIDASGALDKQTTAIDNSMGQQVKVMDAHMQQLEERGQIWQSIWAHVLRGTVGQFGGKQGAQDTTAVIDEMLKNPPPQGSFSDPFNIRGGAGLPAPSISKEPDVYDSRLRPSTTTGILPVITSRPPSPIAPAPFAPEPFGFGDFARKKITGGENLFPSSVVDAGKDTTMAQFNQAKALAVQLSQQQIQAEITYLSLLRLANGQQALSAEEIKKSVAAMQEEIDKTILLVNVKGKIQVLQGAEAKNYQEASSRVLQNKPAESNFAFQRQKDISPDQFPQLQALAQMYNQFLSKIGDPSKNQNINLLLGEENVFKTLNVRMGALSLALEDLTKVEKAQLSGTWNLPQGATALVPISSLDIQRGFGQGGGAGGMTPESIMKMLSAVGASGAETGGTGGGWTELKSSTDNVSGAVNESAVKIVAAINKMFPGANLEAPKSSAELEKALIANATKLTAEGRQGEIPRSSIAMIQGEMAKFMSAWKVPFDAMAKQDKSQQEPTRSLVGRVLESPNVPQPVTPAQVIPPAQKAFTPLPIVTNPLAAGPFPSTLPPEKPYFGQDLSIGASPSAPAQPTAQPTSLISLINAIERLVSLLSPNQGGAQGQPAQAATQPMTIGGLFSTALERLGTLLSATKQSGGGGVIDPLSQKSLLRPESAPTALPAPANRDLFARAPAPERALEQPRQLSEKTDNSALIAAIKNTQVNPVSSVLPLALTSTLERLSASLAVKGGESTLSKDSVGKHLGNLAIQNTVNVSMLPIKTALTANLSVNLNGQIIARAIFPFLFDMLTRTAVGSGQNQTTMGGIR